MLIVRDFDVDFIMVFNLGIDDYFIKFFLFIKFSLYVKVLFKCFDEKVIKNDI